MLINHQPPKFFKLPTPCLYFGYLSLFLLSYIRMLLCFIKILLWPKPSLILLIIILTTFSCTPSIMVSTFQKKSIMVSWLYLNNLQMQIQYLCYDSRLAKDDYLGSKLSYMIYPINASHWHWDGFYILASKVLCCLSTIFF